MWVIVSTDGVAPREREALWRQALSETFVPMTVGQLSGDRFSGSIRAEWLGRLLVARVAATAQHIQRTHREIGRSDHAYLQLAVVTAGVATMAQDGREVQLGPGDVAVQETTRPFRWRFGSDWQVAVLTLPRASVALTEAQARRLTARRLDGRRGVTGVVGRFLGDLAANAEHLAGGGGSSERVLADLADLVVALLGDQASDGQVGSWGQRALLARARDYIQGRLGDPGLGPAEIAAGVHISPRYLHRLFAATDRSVGQYVRGLRLERVRRDLVDPRLADRSIAAIAFGWGFGDLSGFNRAFKAAYGLTPHQLRNPPTNSGP